MNMHTVQLTGATRLLLITLMTSTDFTVDILAQGVRLEYLFDLCSDFVTVKSLHSGLPFLSDLFGPWAIYYHPHTYCCDSRGVF